MIDSLPNETQKMLIEYKLAMEVLRRHRDKIFNCAEEQAIIDDISQELALDYLNLEPLDDVDLMIFLALAVTGAPVTQTIADFGAGNATTSD